MQVYQYLPQIQKQLNKTRLNILILSLNQLTECVNINFNQHNCFILCKTQIDRKFNYCFNRQYDNPIKYENTYILHFPGKDKSAMYTIAKFKNIV